MRTHVFGSNNMTTLSQFSWAGGVRRNSEFYLNYQSLEKCVVKLFNYLVFIRDTPIWIAPENQPNTQHLFKSPMGAWHLTKRCSTNLSDYSLYIKFRSSTISQHRQSRSAVLRDTIHADAPASAGAPRCRASATAALVLRLRVRPNSIRLARPAPACPRVRPAIEATAEMTLAS